MFDFAEFNLYSNMANTAQARKRARQSVERNKHNSSLRSMLRTAIKRVRQSIAAGDKAAAGDVFQKASSVIDRVADKNIIHKNKAARHKSCLLYTSPSPRDS